jgi:hypothetical protein
MADRDDRSGAWVTFAGIVLIVAAVSRLFDAIWAFRYHGVLPSNLEGALFGHSLNTYGWLWLGVAIILFVAGLGVMAQSRVAQWVGVFAGALGSISAIWWIPYYPVWSLLYFGIGVLVIYALLAHGSIFGHSRAH